MISAPLPLPPFQKTGTVLIGMGGGEKDAASKNRLAEAVRTICKSGGDSALLYFITPGARS